MVDVDETKWVGWSDAWERAKAAGYCASGAMPHVLADWARSETVETRARLLMIDDKGHVHGHIPVKVWRDAAGNSGRIDWANGGLQSQTSLHGLRQGSSRVKAHGIEFRADQLDTLAPPLPEGAEPLTVPANVKGGGRGLSKHWPAFVAELSVWIYENNDFVGMTASKLIDTINERLAKRGIDEMPRSTADASVKAVLSALGEASLAD